MPRPVGFAGKGLAALPRVRTVRLGAVELLCQKVFVVDVSFEMRRGPKRQRATRVWTLERFVVVSLVMTTCNGRVSKFPRLARVV